jgi:hypothetical protein
MKLQIQGALHRFAARMPSAATRDVQKRWHYAAAALFGLQAAVILLFGVPHNVSVMVSYVTNDTLQAQLTHHIVASPAIRQWFIVNVSYILAAYLAIMAAWHAFSGYHMRNGSGERQGTGIRWMAYGASLALALSAIALLVGPYSIENLLAVACLCLGSAMVTFAYEVISLQVVKHSGALRTIVGVAGIGLALAPFVVLMLYISASAMYGSSVTYGYTYGMLATVLCWVGVVGTIAYLSGRKHGKWGTYLYAEQGYTLVTFLFLSAFAWEVFIAVLRP